MTKNPIMWGDGQFHELSDLMPKPHPAALWWSPDLGSVSLRYRVPERTVRLIEIGDRARAYERPA